MKIETEFNVGDEVYCLNGGFFSRGVIHLVNVTHGKALSCSIFYTIKTSCHDYKYREIHVGKKPEDICEKLLSKLREVEENET